MSNRITYYIEAFINVYGNCSGSTFTFHHVLLKKAILSYTENMICKINWHSEKMVTPESEK